MGQEIRISYTGPGNDVGVDTRKDLLNTWYVQCECGESEPSSIYTYRYLINNWPNLCFLTMSGEDNIDKVDRGGYINMWAVSSDYKKRNTVSTLVQKATEAVV